MESKDPEVEVNDYLARAIDARSIDRLRAEHCRRWLLTFRSKDIEKKVRYVFAFQMPTMQQLERAGYQLQYNKERDNMMEAYFVCSLIIFLAVVLVQSIVAPE